MIKNFQPFISGMLSQQGTWLQLASHVPQVMGREVDLSDNFAYYVGLMLNIFRKNTRLIIWIVVISFVAWGGGAMISSGDFLSPYAGEVFGKKIKLRDFEKQKKLLKLLLPIEYSNLPDNVLNLETFRQIALTTRAKQKGIKVSDAEVRQTVEQMLGNINSSDFNQYKRWTKSVLGENPRDFEETLRNALLAQKYSRQLLSEAGVHLIEDPDKLSKDELKKIAEKNQEIQQQALSEFFYRANIKSRLPA